MTVSPPIPFDSSIVYPRLSTFSPLSCPPPRYPRDISPISYPLQCSPQNPAGLLRVAPPLPRPLPRDMYARRLLALDLYSSCVFLVSPFSKLKAMNRLASSAIHRKSISCFEGHCPGRACKPSPGFPLPVPLSIKLNTKLNTVPASLRSLAPAPPSLRPLRALIALLATLAVPPHLLRYFLETKRVDLV